MTGSWTRVTAPGGDRRILLVPVFTAAFVTAAFWGSALEAVAVLGGIPLLWLIWQRPAVALIAALCLFPYGTALPGLTFYRLVNFGLPILILGSWVLREVGRRRRVSLLPPMLNLWFLVWIAWLAVSALLSDSPRTASGDMIRYILLFLVLVAATNLWTPRHAATALLVSSVLLVPIAVHATYQIATLGVDTVLFGRLQGPMRLSSFFTNPNSLGTVMAQGFVILAARILVPARSGSRVPRGVLPGLAVVAAVLLVGLLVSFSRASLLYVAAAGFVLLGAHPRLRAWLVSGVLVAAVAVAAAGLPPWIQVALRTGAGASSREALWSAGLAMMTDHPWTGIGRWDGSFESHRSQYFDTAVQRDLSHTMGGGAHNVFINNGATLGVIGLLLTIALFVILYVHVPRGMARYRRGDWVQGAAAAGLVGLLVRGLFESGGTLGSGPVAESFVFFLFGLLVMHRDPDPPPGSPPPPHSPPRAEWPDRVQPRPSR